MHITKLIQLLSDAIEENIDENANCLLSLFILKPFYIRYNDDITTKINFFFSYLTMSFFSLLPCSSHVTCFVI
jgi:hypothetical protein